MTEWPLERLLDGAILEFQTWRARGGSLANPIRITDAVNPINRFWTAPASLSDEQVDNLHQEVRALNGVSDARERRGRV